MKTFSKAHSVEQIGSVRLFFLLSLEDQRIFSARMHDVHCTYGQMTAREKTCIGHKSTLRFKAPGFLDTTCFINRYEHSKSFRLHDLHIWTWKPSRHKVQSTLVPLMRFRAANEPKNCYLDDRPRSWLFLALKRMISGEQEGKFTTSDQKDERKQWKRQTKNWPVVPWIN